MEQNMNNNPETGEKTFTQEQVNAIIGERLAKEKTKGEAALAEREQQFAERERQLANREALFNLKDKLKGKGLPDELLPVLNVTDTAALDTALEALETYIADRIENHNKRLKVLPYELPIGEHDIDEPIDRKLRNAMHLPK